jgi:hypothetical protein
MIDLKTILSAVARTFGVSGPEDLRKQKRVASKPSLPRVDPNTQQSRVDPDKSPNVRVEAAKKS